MISDIEELERRTVVAAALMWLGTPFVMNAAVRGSGVDCLRLIYRAHVEAGLIEDLGHDPWPHISVQWSQHQTRELLVEFVEQHAKAVYNREPLPADIVLIKRQEDLCYAHAGLVVDWPKVLHVMDQDQGVRLTDIRVLLRRFPKTDLRFFSYWG